MATTTPSTKRRQEFGDYQTPVDLAGRICRLLVAIGVRPHSIIEPTCGKGHFLKAAERAFPSAQLMGLELQSQYADEASQHVRSANVVCGDFFSFDWTTQIQSMRRPRLVLGNPPWVTNSTQSRLNSHNVPVKSNAHGERGIDAITGKSNFDISQAIIQRCCEWFNDSGGWLAVLCKTTVARKVIQRLWSAECLTSSRMYKIDSHAHFSATVDACLLVVQLDPASRNSAAECQVFDDLESEAPSHSIGLRYNAIIANLADFDRYERLHAPHTIRWRSGIKHDCSAVMQLQPRDTHLVNGEGAIVEIEPDLVFPLLKSSDLAADELADPRYRVLVPQSRVGQPTDAIQHQFPRTWKYLQRNSSRLRARSSSIYRNKPPFSVFGIGKYSFAPWKVAVAGMYKRFRFHVVGPIAGKPVMLDDTCYFLGFEHREPATELCRELNATAAQTFLNSLTFWDEKRPVTAQRLSRLNLAELNKDLYDIWAGSLIT